MTGLLLAAATLCLTVDGAPVEPLELMDPPITATTPQGQEVVALNYADALRLALLMRQRGFTLDQIVGALMPQRIVPEGAGCGCQIGYLWKPSWYMGKKSCLTDSYYDGPLCIKCTVCPRPDDPPVAMWKP